MKLQMALLCTRLYVAQVCAARGQVANVQHGVHAQRRQQRGVLRYNLDKHVSAGGSIGAECAYLRRQAGGRDADECLPVGKVQRNCHGVGENPESRCDDDAKQECTVIFALNCNVKWMRVALHAPENDFLCRLQRLADLHGMDALGQQHVACLRQRMSQGDESNTRRGAAKRF